MPSLPLRLVKVRLLLRDIDSTSARKLHSTSLAKMKDYH